MQAVGPCIGNKSYEVDLKFYSMKTLCQNLGSNKRYFSNIKAKTKKLFNLRKFVADKLLKLGVKG